jgi:choice-of-anchor C domain-containing protein
MRVNFLSLAVFAAVFALPIGGRFRAEEPAIPLGEGGAADPFFALPEPARAEAEAVPALAPVGDAGLAVNGGFERRTTGEANPYIESLFAGDDALAGWEVLGRSIDWLGPTRWRAADGGHCLDLDGPSGGIRQELRTKAGTTYVLSFRMAANVEISQEPKCLELLIDDDRLQFHFQPVGRTPQDLGWTAYTVAFTAARDGTLLTFRNTETAENAAGVALDQVSVHPAEEAQGYSLVPQGEEAILLERSTGRTWRLVPSEGRKVWEPIER